MEKKFYLLLLVLTLFALSLSAQMKILFVDDSTDEFGNAELIASSIDSLGFEYDYFHAADSASSPSDLLMKNYDLVIWSTSSIGFNLQLWNGIDEDNSNLKAYLDNGGKLWITGNDFLFDKYGAPPYTFSPGEFMYDYAGVHSYDVQSYGDDGSIGLSSASVADSSGIEALNDLSWIFSTLWWADGVSLLENSKPVYLMGGDTSYPLLNKTCASLHATDGFEVLTYFFDLSLVNNFDALKSNMEAVLSYFQGELSELPRVNLHNAKLEVYPNPVEAGRTLSIDFVEASNSAEIPQIQIFDLQGKLVYSKSDINWRNSSTITITIPEYLTKGLYSVLTVYSGVKSHLVMVR